MVIFLRFFFFFNLSPTMPHRKKEKLAIAEYLVWAGSAHRLPLSPSHTSSKSVNQSYYSSLERPNSISGSLSTP